MSNVTSSEDGPIALPRDVDQRLAFWHGLWHRSSMYHYFFGVISVAASVISTSTEGTAAKVCSIVAAIATSLIGFMHPERRYLKFIGAWRVLDVAAMRYRHGLIDKAALIDAVEKGESSIAEFEKQFSSTSDAEGGNKGAADRPADPTPAAGEPAADTGQAPVAETPPSADNPRPPT
jgi:hypothetical protein